MAVFSVNIGFGFPAVSYADKPRSLDGLEVPLSALPSRIDGAALQRPILNVQALPILPVVSNAHKRPPRHQLKRPAGARPACFRGPGLTTAVFDVYVLMVLPAVLDPYGLFGLIDQVGA